MTTLLVGFDSAWTPNNSGALVGVLHLDDGTYYELGPPRIADYVQAQEIILGWQAELVPTATLIMLDQPTIVKNTGGQRPVENIVASAVSRRCGGVQPASTSRAEMFGTGAPMWPFLTRFGGPADPLEPAGDTLVFETYPVLAMIALLWTLPDSRAAGRLPKYNPERRKTFSISDWQHVCGLASVAFHDRGLVEIVRWLGEAASKTSPRKSAQDCLDACLCLLVALYLIERKDCLMVGDQHTGYIVVPHHTDLMTELEARCIQTHRSPSECVRLFRLPRTKPGLAAVAPHSATIDGAEGVGVQKRYHEMTPAERTTARIAKNRGVEKNLGRSASRWSLDEIVAQLNARRQRASYGAVAKLVGVLPRGLMNGRPQSREYSWVVAVSGSRRGWPTNYNIEQIHPDCLRQIREGRENIIESEEGLKRWLGSGSAV